MPLMGLPCGSVALPEKFTSRGTTVVVDGAAACCAFTAAQIRRIAAQQKSKFLVNCMGHAPVSSLLTCCSCYKKLEPKAPEKPGPLPAQLISCFPEAARQTGPAVPVSPSSVPGPAAAFSSSPDAAPTESAFRPARRITPDGDRSPSASLLSLLPQECGAHWPTHLGECP